MTNGAQVAVLANPIAGRGKRGGVIADVVGRLRAARFSPRVLTAGTRAEALDACLAAVADRPAALVAVGGDGTVHLALQAVADTDTPLGVVPIGTGNDFAGALELPLAAEPAIKAVVSALREGRTRDLDLARASQEDAEPLWYGTVLSAGLDASINERANRMRWPKGPRRYDLSILVEIARLTPHAYRLVVDGQPRELDAMIIAVGNTTRYGGGLPICPRADPADGLLDLTVVGPIGRAAAIRLNSQVRKGTHLDDNPAVCAQRARRVEIHGPRMRTYADGERGLSLPVSIDCVPGALHLLA